MEVILLERVAKLGQMGEVVRVKDGFARNFLLPRGKALRATKDNREKFDSMKADLEARNLQAKGEATKVETSEVELSELIRQVHEIARPISVVQLRRSRASQPCSHITAATAATAPRPPSCWESGAPPFTASSRNTGLSILVILLSLASAR